MYYFYVGSVLLPVTPDKFTLKVKNANKTMTLINEGEVNFLRQAGLTDFEFDALIPAVEYSFANYDGGFKSPSYYVNYFEELKTSKKPFQFIVTRQMPDGKLLFDNNISVSMESYTIKEQANEGFDLVVSIKLKQYKAYGTKVVKVVGNTASVTNQRPTTNSPAPEKDTTITTKDNDTLPNIAKETTGSWNNYENFKKANPHIADVTNIPAGTQVNIPTVKGRTVSVN